MSFNAKNLSYDESNEPAFLRRLKNQYGDGSATRHERPNSRPANPRLANDSDDDAPAYVVEDSNETLSKEEYEALFNPDSLDAKDDTHAEDSVKDEAQPSAEDIAPDVETKTSEPKRQQNLAEIGASKKRKQARVVLDDKEPEEKEEEAKKPQPSKKKTKQKKKIKLSFADEDE